MDGGSGLDDQTRSGQPRKLTAEKTKEVLDTKMHTLPKDATRGSLKSMAEHTGLTHHLVATVWSAAKLKPHLSSTFNFNTNPEFAEKVIDFVGLYRNSPDAIMPTVDGKTQIEVLDNTTITQQAQFRGQTHKFVFNKRSAKPFVWTNDANAIFRGESEGRSRDADGAQNRRKDESNGTLAPSR